VFKQYPRLVLIEIRMMEQALGTQVNRQERRGSQGVKCTVYRIGTLG
jgi:hypothetical protein